jgi:SNF2 family DNA or RNA helicase
VKPIVIIESPYGSGSGPNGLATLKELARNKNYLQLAIRDSLLRGEAPFASHRMYPGALDDRVLEERRLGIEVGLVFYEVADMVAGYTDYGVTEGMKKGIEHAKINFLGDRVQKPQRLMEAPTKSNPLLEKLRVIRSRKDLKPLPPTPLLKTEIRGLDGELTPLQIRYYQIQAILTMLAMKRMVLGDDTGIGKTFETLATLCYLWGKHPNTKVVVVAPKSALRQWASEIAKFTQGVKSFVVADQKIKDKPPAEARRLVYEEWFRTDRSVLILSYKTLIIDWNYDGYRPLLPGTARPDPKQPVIPGMLDRLFKSSGPNLVLIYDECTAFKETRTKTWEICRYAAQSADRVYGLTATLLKNRLFEGYGIYKVIVPTLFRTKTGFMKDFCYVELLEVQRGRKIPIIKGYKNLDQFRRTIEPVYLGRAKHTVTTDLPVLTTREFLIELNRAERIKYQEALRGLIELGDGDLKSFSETKALTSLIYCQQVVNSLALLKFQEGDDVGDFSDVLSGDTAKVGSLSSKEAALIDLLTDELDGAKVIVYTRFASHTTRLCEILAKHKIRAVKITGAENTRQRDEAQAAFQDLKSDVRVVVITNAGSEAINLQAGAALIYFDMPWSWGDFVQILGRMVRIGSPHRGVLVYLFLAELDGEGKARKTIDHHVLTLLRKKKRLIEQVLSADKVGAIELEKDKDGSTRDLFRLMRESQKVVRGEV